MKRREFTTLLGGAAVAWPLTTRAEQVGRRRLVGLVAGFSEADMRLPLIAFRSKLSELGGVEGRTLVIDTLSGAGDYERMTADAEVLVRRNPDVIVTIGTPALAAVRQHTRNTPVVFAVVADPVRAGIVESLARPGGQTTGFTNFEFSIGGKWLELLREVSPRLTHVMVLDNPTNTATNALARFIEDAGRSTSIEILTTSVRNLPDVQAAISNGARQPNCGLIVLPDGMTLVHSASIVSLANRHGLPSVYPYRVFAEKGGLLTYGLDIAEMYRRSAGYVDRILKGEKPADLAVQAPNKFELIINLKTAKTLGLEIPPVAARPRRRGDRMSSRRKFITLLGGAAAAWPIAARAQQPTMPVIGFLSPGSPEAHAKFITGFRKGLSEAGYVGRNVAIEYRWAYGESGRLLGLAAERRTIPVII